MNIFKKIYCRSFQTVFKIALPFLPYRKPKIVSALSDIPSVLNKKKKSCPIIITDPETKEKREIEVPVLIQSYSLE